MTLPTLRAKTHRVFMRAVTAPHLPVAWYLLYGAAYTIIKGPGVVMSTMPVWLTYWWTTSLILGAVLTTVGTTAGHNRTESAGHGFHLFGLGLYALTAFLLIGFSGGLVVVIFALGGVSASRLYVLSRARKARDMAGRLSGGGLE